VEEFRTLLPKQGMDILMGFAKARALNWLWQMIHASVGC